MTIDTTQNIQTQRRASNGKLLPKIVDTPMKPVIDALNACLRRIREINAEVPNVVLVVGTSSKKNWGHFSPGSWESKGAQHEIMLSGESLKRGADAVLGVLIHECAHALAETREIKDTSRQGRFHNKKFKALAEELGIEVGINGMADPSIGWSFTTLPKETAKLYAPELRELSKALKAYRIPVTKPAPPKTTMRIECKCRKVTVPILFFEKGGLTCDACNAAFVEVGGESSPEDDES